MAFSKNRVTKVSENGTFTAFLSSFLARPYSCLFILFMS